MNKEERARAYRNLRLLTSLGLFSKKQLEAARNRMMDNMYGTNVVNLGDYRDKHVANKTPTEKINEVVSPAVPISSTQQDNSSQDESRLASFLRVVKVIHTKDGSGNQPDSGPSGPASGDDV